VLCSALLVLVSRERVQGQLVQGSDAVTTLNNWQCLLYALEKD
jgi:hypothetical protein